LIIFFNFTLGTELFTHVIQKIEAVPDKMMICDLLNKLVL